ncbi:MAG: NAD(P)/FAD-dependent oxidoreductase [Rhodocyclaceae bacterium]|nr:NAD(P)/FAD-dependent oxidoreductase [Rhodocyclaceae bacterium]
MEEREVIVVGSGPAGAACARALRDEGVDVLVLEKEALPRYKCCSGILFGQTQELLTRYFGAGAPDSVRCHPEIIQASEIRQWKPDGSRGDLYCYEIDKDGQAFTPDFINIWRNSFDKWLLDMSGAPCRDQSKVQGFEMETDGVRIAVAQPGPEGGSELRTYRCQYLIGADGGNSMVRRLLQPGSFQTAKAAGNLQSYYRLESLGKLTQGFSVFFLPQASDAFCCAHPKDGYLLLSVGGFRGIKLREAMETFRRFLVEEYGVGLGEKWRDEGCQMMFARPVLGEGRVILTGEAANFMYLNGEGIAVAIDSGYRCGQEVARALREGGSPLPGYAENTRDIVAHMKKCMAQANFVSPKA